MNRGLWISRKNYLCSLIKKVSDGHGGDDIVWLREHCFEVIESHPDELIEDAIVCYFDLVEQLRYYPRREPENESK